jgi:hypothetical protein
MFCNPSANMVNHSDNFNVYNTLDTPHSIQHHSGAVCNNGNLAQLQIANQYVLPIVMSLFIFLTTTVSCTCVQWVCLKDSISLQFKQLYNEIINILSLTQQYICYIILMPTGFGHHGHHQTMSEKY